MFALADRREVEPIFCSMGLKTLLEIYRECMGPALGLEGRRSVGQQAQPFLVLDHLANGDSSIRCQLRVG